MSAGPLASQLARQCRSLLHVRGRIERALRDDAPQCLRHLVITSDTDYRTLVWFLMQMEQAAVSGKAAMGLLRTAQEIFTSLWRMGTSMFLRVGVIMGILH